MKFLDRLDDTGFKGQDIADVACLVLFGENKTAVKYVSPKLVLKATLRHKRGKVDQRREAVITVGEPNYQERIFIKKLKEAKEPFPVKKIQLKFDKVK